MSHRIIGEVAFETMHTLASRTVTNVLSLFRMGSPLYFRYHRFYLDSHS